MQLVQGNHPLASEIMSSEVHRGLGNQVIRALVLSMLQRDAAKRPKCSEIVQHLMSMFQQRGGHNSDGDAD